MTKKLCNLKSIALIAILQPIVIFSQQGKVGINTSSPTEVLDINGTIRGRNLPLSGASNSIWTKADGTISASKDQIFSPTKTVVADENGVLGLSTGIPGKIMLMDMYMVVGDNKITQDIYTNPADNDGSFFKSDIDLGITKTITIPAGKKYMISVNYSVPIGTNITDGSRLAGYYGIRFLKNGTEKPEGSRKYTIPQPSGLNDPLDVTTPTNNSTINISRMSTVAGSIVDEIDNTASTVDLNVSYTLNGYLEIYANNVNDPNFERIHHIYFNRWDATGKPNYNWGVANMTISLFDKR